MAASSSNACHIPTAWLREWTTEIEEEEIRKEEKVERRERTWTLMNEPIDHFRADQTASMHFQMILPIANHLRSFVQDTRSKNIGSMLNSNRCILIQGNSVSLSLPSPGEKIDLTGMIGKAGFRPETNRWFAKTTRTTIYSDHLWRTSNWPLEEWEKDQIPRHVVSDLNLILGFFSLVVHCLPKVLVNWLRLVITLCKYCLFLCEEEEEEEGKKQSHLILFLTSQRILKSRCSTRNNITTDDVMIVAFLGVS